MLEVEGSSVSQQGGEINVYGEVGTGNKGKERGRLWAGESHASLKRDPGTDSTLAPPDRPSLPQQGNDTGFDTESELPCHQERRPADDGVANPDTAEARQPGETDSMHRARGTLDIRHGMRFDMRCLERPRRKLVLAQLLCRMYATHVFFGHLFAFHLSGTRSFSSVIGVSQSRLHDGMTQWTRRWPEDRRDRGRER